MLLRRLALPLAGARGPMAALASPLSSLLPRAAAVSGGGRAVTPRPAMCVTSPVRCLSTEAVTEHDSSHYDSGWSDNAVTSEDRRAFTYFMFGVGRFAYAAVVRVGVIKFLASMSAAADVLALASLEVDLSGVEPGNCVTVKWRGKPVFVKHRTEKEISDAVAVPLSELRHPETDSQRYLSKPQWLIVIGICTHLGCVPIPKAGHFAGGWFCPCHGSHYDSAGRIRLGPAPLNLNLPPYSINGTQLIIG